MTWFTDLALQWYAVLSQWSAAAGEPLQRLLGAQSIPGLSALLLGILGGLAPCQVSANAGAIAYVAQADERKTPLWRVARDFLFGKMAVYVVLGFLAAMLGLRIPSPVLAWLRRLSGPLMIGIGLYLAGWIRSGDTGGARVTEWLQQRLPRRGSPPFWLGLAFSLGFCPTMAVIFFGALVPLIIQAPAGMVLPVVFAVGTALPVILWAAALSVGRRAAGRWVRRLRSLDRYVRWVAVGIFLLLGLNDLILYWLV